MHVQEIEIERIKPYEKNPRKNDGAVDASTMTSQAIDTAIFITIAFWGIVPNLPLMIVSQYAIKLIIAALDTPVFYLLTRRK